MDALTAFSSASKLEGEDPRWTRLLSTTSLLGLNGSEESTQSILNKLVDNNLNTRNLQQLESLATAKLNQLLNRKDGSPPSQESSECCVALHLLALSFSYISAFMNSSQIRRQLSLSPGWPAGAGGPIIGTGNAITESLFDAAIRAIAQYPAQQWSYDLALCSCNLILSACSTQLYPRDDEQPDDLFLEFLFLTADSQLRQALSFGDRDVAGTLPARLVRGLLIRAMDSAAVPPKDSITKSFLAGGFPVVAHGGRHSLSQGRLAVRNESAVGGDVQALWRIILKLIRIGPLARSDDSVAGGEETTDGSAGPADASRQIRHAAPLRERCTSLLSVLLHNRRTNTNAMRECFCLLRDDKLDEGDFSDDLETQTRGGGMTLQRRVQIDFCQLADGLAKSLPGEGATLLLYPLLQTHPTFTETMLQAGKLEPILNSVCRGLYDVVDGTAALGVDNLYCLIVCTLMLVADLGLREKLATMKTSAPWYRERTLGEVSIADLFLLCTLRVTMVSIFRFRDAYLLQNCFAVLLNLAPAISAMHIYLAERIVKLMLQLGKRVILEETSSTPVTAEKDTMGIVMETLGVLVRVAAVALRHHKRSSNVHLVYALIHEGDKVKQILGHPAIRSLKLADSSFEGGGENELSVNEIVDMIVRYLDTLHVSSETGEDGSSAYLSAAQAEAALQALIQQDQDNGVRGNDMTFAYVEGDQPEQFFVPCAWAAVVRSAPELSWHLPSVALFNCLEKGLALAAPTDVLSSSSIENV